MNKCCKTCKNFKDEDADGYGWCELQQEEVTGYFSHPCHEPLNNGWSEITPDNVDKIRKNKGNIVVMNPKEWNVPEMLYSLPADTLVLYSEWGGYYYYVLPELKIE